MSRWRSFLAGSCAFMVIALFPAAVFADAAPGDTIVTLGENLSKEERTSILNEMNVSEDVEIVTVTNEEEHNYLGDYMSAGDIGSRALSSAKITLTKQGQGIHVDTNNITKVSEGMYANTMITAGVEDADVYITAPFGVSGTAALTGIIKAYEIQNDIQIPEEQKKVANEEMVKTSELGERIGTEEATELITRIKEELGKKPVESEADLRDLIKRVASELGIDLTEDELDGLVSLFNRMKDLNIDWDQVQSQITKVRDNLDEFLNREDTQSVIQKFLDFVNELIDSLRGWLGGESESS
ncbi:DUF1002 domain-containing protein [Bacillus piscicola]|uniref:DUF1002 domain-containing protein n=1 Tax=Bacillus piscicola TaxID=1632684 RepID=UPI001F09E070|nr:DUF1002 domain-containing protein [Bacillus piscicola]